MDPECASPEDSGKLVPACFEVCDVYKLLAPKCSEFRLQVKGEECVLFF